MPRLYTTEGSLCGTFLAGTTVCGQADDQFILPDTLTLQDDDLDFRFEESERSWRDGSAVYGEEWDARDVVLAGSVWQGESANLSGAQALIRAIKKAAGRLDQRLEVDAGQYINVARLRRVDVRPVELTGRLVLDLRVVWRAADPFWYADGLSDDVQVLAGDDNWTLSTGFLTGVNLYPVIVVEAPNPGAVGSFILRNASDEGLEFRYQDPGQVDGAAVVIDCQAGTVRRGGVNTVRFFEGGWLRLLPGSNDLEYEGPAATVTITWRERWA